MTYDLSNLHRLPGDLNKRAKMVLYRLPDYQTSFKPSDLSVQKKSIEFQDDGHGGHPGFPVGNLHVTSILPMKFRVNWPFS